MNYRPHATRLAHREHHCAMTHGCVWRHGHMQISQLEGHAHGPCIMGIERTTRVLRSCPWAHVNMIGSPPWLAMRPHAMARAKEHRAA
eukprot:623537-Prymnesium_polylepis.1